MAVIGRIPERVELPHEPGNWIEVRGLGWAVLEEAQTLRMQTLSKAMKDLDLSGLEKMSTPEQRANAEQLDAANNSYDQKLVLMSGLVGWSYEAPLDEATILDLDEETATFAFEEILRRSRRKAEERKS